MKIFSDWGFTRQGWLNNMRGEYWVLAQAALLILFIILPVYRLDWLNVLAPEWVYFTWSIAAILGLGAALFLLKGLLDLGQQLTPLPYPKDEGQLVQSGVYSVVRHPLYSGVILLALSWAIFQFSLSHFLGAIALFIFLDVKARREENWLTEKYADYADYRQRVKKLIPWLY